MDPSTKCRSAGGARARKDRIVCRMPTATSPKSSAHSFNDIHRGVPLMSRTLLAERLRQLEENGIIVRRIHPDDSACEYWLTPSCEAFHDVLRDLSRWGLAHARDRLTADDLNPGLLMWRMRKRVDICALPERRVVIRFEFS